MSTPYSLKGTVPVLAIREHTRTIRGRRNPTSGESIVENVSLGWFLHLQLDGGVFAFRHGPTPPEGIAEGDRIEITLRKV